MPDVTTAIDNPMADHLLALVRTDPSFARPRSRVKLFLTVPNRYSFCSMALSDDAAASPGLPQFVADLEAELQRNSDNLEAREHLIDYYFEQLVRSDAGWGGANHDAWAEHVYWVIQHRPESRLAGSPRAMVQPPCGTEENYESGKQLWLKQTELHRDEPAVLANAAHYLRLNDRAIAEALLERAYGLRPGDPDIAKLLCAVYRRSYADSDISDLKRHDLARKAFAVGEQSLNVSPIDRFYRLDDVAEAALEAGEFDKAGGYAQELLNAATEYKSNWNYGNAMHNGNLILGRVAIRRGDLAKAGEYLLRAGETRGSPQLNSFGPDMALARELLENDQHDVVIRYFDLCARFWEAGRDRLRSWRSDVEQGRVPEFES
jgi:tetratricopeptide (TPR) repeat protein